MLVMSMMIWADRTLYFVPNSNWTQANAKFAAYYFDNAAGTNGWSAIMETVENETNLYTTTIPDGFPTVIFVRLNASATECNWGSKWNQSADITLPTDGKDLFTLADGWDSMSGTWSNYAAPQQQDTTNVSPLADKHFYLNGEFLNWDTQRALEFTLADSLFTLTVDTLSGIFKVMTARNWEAPDYGGDYNVNLTLGVPYTLTERGYDLSCSTIYLNAELQLRLVGNDVILTLVSGTPVQQDTTGTPEPVATPHFYLTGNEAFVGAGKTAWNKEDGYVSYGDTLTLTLAAGTYEIQLINANDEWKGYDALSQPIADNITTNSWGNICFYMAQAGQVTFIYKTDNTFLIQGTFAKPRYHFYYIGTAVNWIVNDALEFEYQDSVYTLSLATLEGEFKIMTARDWSELSFGRNSSTEYITPGVPYEMTAWTDANIVVNGTLSNVTLQLTYVNQVATITVIENNPGGEQPQDTTIVPPVVDEVTVYTIMPEGWATLNAYVWPDEGANYVAWPGEAMTLTEDTFGDEAIYSYTFPVNYTHIIFNNGEGSQTANLDVNPATPCYYDNAWHATFEATPVDTTGGGEQPQDTTIVTPGPQDTTQVEMITYYAVNTPRWSLPYAYVWDDVLGAYRTWPGEVMDQTGINFRGYEVYSYTMPKEYTMMIINNGKGGNDNQTPDMVLDTTLRYMYNLQWYASLEAIPAEQQDTTGTNPQDTTSVTPEVEHYYLIGAFNEWNVETALEFFNLDSFYTLKTASLEGEFKILTARSWDATNYGAANGGDQLVPGDEYELNSNSAPNLSVNGAYTNVILTLTKANDILKLYFAAGTPVQQDTTGTNPQDTTQVEMITYYAVNTPRWSLPYAYVWDDVLGAYRTWPGEVMDQTGINFRGYEVYSYTMPKEYTMMIINNGKGGDNNQTPDMQLDTTLRYMYNLQWYASLEAIPADQQDTTGTNPQDTTIVPPVVDTHYYIKNNWNGGEWTWQPMVAVESVNEDTTILLWSYTDVFGGTGVNISVSDNNEAPIDWYEIADFIIADGDLIPQAMDSVTFIYDAGSHHVHAFVINRPGDQPVDPQPVVNDITVYTVMPEGWGALNAYIWIGNQGYVAWPGEAMTNTGETFRGETVYSYTFPETYTSIIFNNGNGEQTIDLTIDTTKLYYYGETWYASWDEVPEEVIILPATYYVSGNENLVTAAGLSPDYAWNAAAIKATSDTLVLNLRANTDYKLRLTLNGTWVSDVKDYYYLTEVTPGLTTDIEANICFTPAEDGPVTIIYNDSVFTVQGNFIVFAKPTYYIKNNWEAGADWTWQQMNAIDNDSIYWGYVGVFGGMGVNIATEGSDSAPTIWFDASSFIVEEGDLIPQPLDTVYFVFDALRETLIAAVINRPGGVEPQPQPETHFYLVGQFNGWDLETAPEFARQDSFVYTMTVDTLFGAMKVVVSRDSWEGNYGVADMNDAVLTIGQTKALVPYLIGISDNFNFSVEGIILNAVLNIVVTDNVVNITLVSGTPYQQPIEDRHFYLVGSFNDWTVTEAPEFTLQDSIYTITIDTMAGEFKVVDARDWLHNIYGAYYYGEVLTPGNEYAMAAMNSENFSLITTYTNVTFNLRVENNVVTIIFVSGTQMPTTGLDTAVGNTAAPVKLIENGALIILRDGVKYNAAGQRIR